MWKVFDNQTGKFIWALSQLTTDWPAGRPLVAETRVAGNEP